MFDIPDAASMIQHISEQIPSLIGLVTAFSYVGGMYMIIANIAGLRNCAYISSPGQNQCTVWEHLKKILIGAALLYLPSTIKVGTETFLPDFPLAYIEIPGMLSHYGIINLVTSVVKLVGVIAVIKGLYTLAQGQGKNSEKGYISPFSKGITHIIGGILCLNLNEFLFIILVTLNINFPK